MNNISKINLQDFGKTFKYRHDFKSEDLDVLYDKFPYISFKNIPEAWIIQIDKMLAKIGDKVEAVYQNYGFMTVILNSKLSFADRDKALKIVSLYENKMYLIDKDLHAKLDMRVIK